MKVVGITGGIGSGKTTVCRIFELLGIPVFYADEEAKKLYKKPTIRLKVIKLFGKKILDANGEVNKAGLAEIIFSDKPSLIRLNKLIHPEVRKKFTKWKKSQKGKKYIIKEAAIMIESGAYNELDYLISVKSPKALRIKRISGRDRMSLMDVERRMNEQISDKKRENYSDAIINNDNRHSLIEQVIRLHKKLI